MSELTTIPDSIRPRRARRWTTAAIGAGVLALVTMGLTPLASAAPGEDPVIDPLQEGSITIHKRLSTSADPATQGQPVASPPGTALPGVEFTVTPVELTGFDLTTNAGWAFVELLAAEFDPNDTGSLNQNTDLDGDPSNGSQTTALDTPLTPDTTDNNGIVTFGNLPVGLYLVEETDGTPAGATPMAPFLVTIPITYTNDNGTSSNPADDFSAWDYDVDIYPKNMMPPIIKDIDGIIAVGSTMTYRIASTIDNSPALEYYRIVDGIPSDVTYTPNTAVVYLIDTEDATPTVGEGTKVALTPGSQFDYTETEITDSNDLQTATGSAPDMGNYWVAFDFDVSVLNNIDYQGWQVVIELPVIITTVSYDEVTNEAWLFPNEASWETGEGPGGPGGGDPIPTDDDPTYRLGNITFKKVDASAGTPLTGVTFAVYTKLQSNGQPDESSRVTIDPDGAGGQPAANTWTSDGQGLITLAGLGLSNWDPNADNGIADGKSGNWITNPSLYSKYYLVEVATLSNYSLLATPVEFFVTDNSANPGVPVDANSDGKPDTTTDEPGPMAVDQTVKNAKLNGGFALPLTGGTGLASLTALALLLGGSGIALLVVRRRRERTAQTTAAL